MDKTRTILFDKAAAIFHALYEANNQTEISMFFATTNFEKLIYDARVYDLLSHGEKENEQEIISEIKNGTFYRAFVFLISIDLYCGAELDKLIKYVKLNRKAELNSLTKNKEVLIYPALCFSEHYYHGYEIFQTIFKNLYFVDISAFGQAEYRIENYYFEKIPNSEERIDICFIPYPFDKNIQQEISGGTVEERKELSVRDEVFIKRVKAFVNSKTEHDSTPTVIFAPEMVGSSLVDSELQKIIEKNKDIISVVAPSYHQLDKDNFIRNKSTLFITEDRTTRIASVTKYRPADVKGVNEKITSNLISLVVIHINGFGKVLFLICRDFLTETMKRIINTIVPDAIVVQCYSPTLRDFEDKIRQICELNNSVVIGNACSSYQLDDERCHSVVIAGSRNKQRSGETFNVQRSDKEVCTDCISNCLYNENCNVLIHLSIETSDKQPLTYIKIDMESDFDGKKKR